MKPERAIAVFSLAVCLMAAQASAQETPAAATGEISLSTGILVDCSGSQRLLLERIVATVKQLADTGQPGDETFVVKFVSTDKITLVQDFTRDKHDVIDAADQLYIEGGQTAIVDAVNFSAKYFSESKLAGEPRRTLILITDGDERESVSQIEATIRYLKENKVRVFSIGIAEGRVVTKLLDKLARETGGKVFLPRTSAEISAAIAEIYSSLRAAVPASK
jgi:Ca-activated chloride channel family protein